MSSTLGTKGCTPDLAQSHDALWDITLGVCAECVNPFSRFMFLAGTVCLLAGREIWVNGKKAWAEDHLFRIERRDGRIGIYIVGSE
jgi:hypothetical protein